mgnify:CR=1 FL=1
MRTMLLTMTVAALVAGLVLAPLGAAADDHDEDDMDEAGLPLAGMKVAMLTGEGFQSQEAMMPVAFLTNRGAEVTVIGTEVGEVKAYDADVHLLIQAAVDDVDSEDFHALVLPGGSAPEKIREDDDIVEFAAEMYEDGKPVAAICHGPQVLITAGVVEDKQMTCYSGVVEELKAAGADYLDAEVVRDANLITSRLPKDIPAWLSAMEELFLAHAPEGDDDEEEDD